METSDKYKSIASPSRGLYKDNGSKFLAFAFPVSSVEQAMEHIQSLKTEYFDARHHCYAYRIGHTGEVWRANDDGEPSSSAGKPILNQILSAGLSDILIVVVRYFGGIKLGIPGLIRAYKTSSAEAIQTALLVEKTACQEMQIEFDYTDMNEVMKILKNFNLAPSSQQFNLKCSLKVDVPLSQVQKLEEAFSLNYNLLSLSIRKT